MVKDLMLIVDEFEFYVYCLIMFKFWDELEVVCLDCFFIFIMYDLEFVVVCVV